MIKQPGSISIVIVIGLMAGCGESTESWRLLDDLRRDGLVVDNRLGEVRPTTDLAANTLRPFDWSENDPIVAAAILAAADVVNPRLAAARARVGAAGSHAWQSSFHPNPSLDLESENVRLNDNGFGVSETTIGISQPLIVGERRDAAIAVGESRVDVKWLEYEVIRREIHGEIRRVLTEIRYLREAIDHHTRLQRHAERTLHIAQTRFEARAVPESEAIRARVEFNSLGLAMDRLRGDLAVAGERLAALLGGEPVPVERIVLDDFNEPHELPSLDTLINLVGSTHPAILAAEARVETARRQVNLELARQQPDITARIGIGVDHADDEGLIEAGISIPLTISDQNQGNILAARFDVIQYRMQAKAVSDELIGRLRVVYRRWESAAMRLTDFEQKILADAQRAHDQASAGYEAGKLPFLDLLDAQRTLSEAQISHIELHRAVRLAYSDTLAILGGRSVIEVPQGETK